MIRATLTRHCSSVGGGRVTSLKAHMPSTIRPTIIEDGSTQLSLRQRMDELLRGGKEESGYSEQESAYQPPLPRKWVRAPESLLSTSVTRRDWFRFMSFNFMADSWTRHTPTPSEGQAVAPPVTTTPVRGVTVRIPKFARPGADGEASPYLNYDPSLDAEMPPFLQPESRCRHLTNEIRHYDPDIVCLNEVNRTVFFDTMWKYVRLLGYGTLYQSSRGANVKALRRGDDPTQRRHQNKIPEYEDIGNVILFHKGRFVPMMLPGMDLPRHLNYMHLTSMRDKITNMAINVASIQLTSGNTYESMEIREHETKQILMIMDALNRNNTDRGHMTNIVCGDLNNVHDEEPCVQQLRNRFFSTYDVAGGPRWTTWYRENPEKEKEYNKYFEKNKIGLAKSDAARIAADEVANHLRYRRTSRTPKINSKLVPTAVRSEEYPSITEHKTVEEAKMKKLQAPRGDGAREGNSTESATDSESTPRSEGGQDDQLMLVKEKMLNDGIVYRTQDFIFYEPRTLALHQVLDTPEESIIDKDELFPSAKLPSHHIPLIIDVSCNDPFPDVGEISLHP